MASILGFLQARMGSTRLPGKVLFDIGGKTILARAIERLQAARLLTGVVVLTTWHPEDDAVIQEAEKRGAATFRGPDLDVLARFRQAADVMKPDILVRATADNPLMDIGSIDRCVGRLLEEGLDFCMEQGLPVGAATEAMTRSALEEADRLGTLPPHREHVTLYIKENIRNFRGAFPEAPEPVHFPHFHITVDTREDFCRVSALIGAVPEEPIPIPLSRYLCRMQMDASPDPKH
jgi:spore coat polysaccharide biosynthesis protein SpsF